MIDLFPIIWYCGEAAVIALVALFIWEIIVDKIKDSVTAI